MNCCWRPSPLATTHPRHRGDWTIARADGTFAAFSPETGTTVTADPPADKQLPALAAALDRGRLISYRIGRRAVVATESNYIKVVRPSRLDAVVCAHQLAASTPSVCAPTIVEAKLAGSIELTPMQGQSLHAIIQQGMLQADVIVGLAQSLAAMHGDIDPGPVAERDADPPQRWIDTVARVDRAAAHDLATLAARLPDVLPGTESVIHGDLHDKNIYVSATGVGFIDLDGLGRGAAECDLANLAVHLKLRALQSEQATGHASALGSLLYSEYGGTRRIDRKAVHAFEQHTWFRLACLYRLRGANCRLTQQIVNELLVV